MLRLIARVRVAAEYRELAAPARAARTATASISAARCAARRAPPASCCAGAAPRRRERLRPIVFLLDVSGSMAPFARALLQYARVTAVARPAVRAFAFATALTDLTPLLKRAGDESLMGAVGAAVRDYGGGTRIGSALRAFNDGFAQRGAARGGTVVILSDGWERDDPASVGRELQRLRRLARRIVWVNPHKRHAAYEPLARRDGRRLAVSRRLPLGSQPADAGRGGRRHRGEDRMIDVLETIERWRGEGQRVAVATVVEVENSAPRDPGAVLAVNERGDVAGSVSGGCVESAVYEEAQDAIASGRPRLVTYGISDADAISVGLTCGGTIHVFVERLDW